MKDNLDNLDNEQQNPTPSKLEEPVILDETPNVEKPQQPVNLDEPPKVDTSQQPANLDEPPKVETPQQPANLEAPPTDSSATPTVPAQHDDLNNPNPEYSETKKMEKIAAIVHNREEYRKQLEEDKRLKEEVEAENKRLNDEFKKLIDKEIINQGNPDALYPIGEEKNRLRQQMIENNARLRNPPHTRSLSGASSEAQ